MAPDERIADLEARIAFQEDTLKILDTALYAQQRRIDALEHLCARLLARLQDAVASAPGVDDDQRPPHY